MKKQTQTIERSFTFISLYRDDFDEILAILGDGTVKYEITVGDFVLDDQHEIDELSQKYEKVKSLSIGNIFTPINLRCNSIACQLYLSADGPEARGRFEKVVEILNRSRTFAYYFLFPLSFLLYCVFGIVVLFLFLKGTAFYVSSAIWFLITLALERPFTERHRFAFFLRRRSDLPNFWVRNKDKIWLAVIGALFGSVVTIVTSRLIK